MTNIAIKPGIGLSEDELQQVQEALHREFNVKLSAENLEHKTFFLLKEGNKICAIGALMEVKPVLYDGIEYTVSAIMHIIANEKGKGYGKEVVTSIREYIESNDKTGLGFCHPKNTGFYQKCGFKTNSDITDRFVYKDGAKKVTNRDGQIIFFIDSSDRLIEKVLAKSSEEVILPSPHLW